jgi:hypothetical protein
MRDPMELDPSRLELAREFKDQPFGRHSPDLQYLLHRMRSYDFDRPLDAGDDPAARAMDPGAHGGGRS